MRKLLQKISARKGSKATPAQLSPPTQLTQEAPICSSCGDVIKNRYLHEPRKCEYAELEITAAHGCDTCSVVAEGIDIYLKELSIVEPISYVTMGAGVWVKVEIYGSQGLILALDFYVTAKPGGSQEHWNRLEPIAHRYIGSEWDLRTAVDWVHSRLLYCGKSHPVCNKRLNKPPFLPNRVLDLGRGNDLNVIHLNETIGQRGWYMTLSHCWGQVHPLTTTKDTLVERTLGIQLKALPKTFRDAVDITRSLGIRYLWIDSLCILQDDKDDWEIESNRMADIYSCSYLTIAATSSHDSNGGCLRQGGKRYCEIKRSGSKAYSIFVRQNGENLHNHKLDGTPLMSRAWVYQERQLSPRLIHFQELELTWECHFSEACECGITKLWYRGNSGGRLDFRFHMKSHKAVLSSWNDVLKSYPRLNLTKIEDKLPALSGIAKVFAERLQQRYFAGMWESRFPENLFWHVIRRDLHLRDHPLQPLKQGVYIAPSWSWITRTDNLRTWDGSEEFVHHPRFTLLDINCDVPGRNPFGRVQSGSLSVRGAYLSRPSKMPETEYTREHQLEFPTSKGSFSFTYQGDDEGLWWASDHREVSLWICLLVGTKMFGTSSFELLALILRRSETQPESYVRIGIVYRDMKGSQPLPDDLPVQEMNII